MSEGDLFFTERNEEVWAVWLSGRPPVNLGGIADVRAAMAQFSIVAGANGAPAHDAFEPNEGRSPPAQPEPPTPPKPRSASERAEPRHGLTMMGKVFTTAGSREVTVLDLSERGCRFRDASGHLAEGTRLSIKLGEVGPVEAMVMWSDGSFVGVRFANPLYPSVMQHIRETYAGRR